MLEKMIFLNRLLAEEREKGRVLFEFTAYASRPGIPRFEDSDEPISVTREDDEGGEVLYPVFVDAVHAFTMV